MSRLGVLAVIFFALPLLAFQDDGPYTIGNGVTPPQLIGKVEPSYTEEARNAKIQGTVVLALIVDVDGRAKDIRIHRSLDPGLDANAVAAVGQWSFKPSEKGGKPVKVAATIEVNFKLQ
jgi:TonB family protein